MAIQEHYSNAGPDSHRWITFDAERYRLDISTSDLRGYEALSHGGRPEGVLREIVNNLEPERPVTYAEMRSVYQAVRESLPQLLEMTGSVDIFTPAMFRRVVSAATDMRP